MNTVHLFLLDGDKGIREKGRGFPGKRRLLSLKGVAMEDLRRQHLKGIKEIESGTSYFGEESAQKALRREAGE